MRKSIYDMNEKEFRDHLEFAFSDINVDIVEKQVKVNFNMLKFLTKKAHYPLMVEANKRGWQFKIVFDKG